MGTKTRRLTTTARLYPIILWVTVVATYLWSLPNGFISDDTNAIVQNGTIRSFQTVVSHPLSFVQPFILFIISSLVGTLPWTAWAYRSINILFHFGSVLFLFLIVRKLSDEKTGFITALLYAVHPALSESVMWISGGNYARYGFFFFASFYSYLQWKESRRFRDYIFHIALYLFCLESSEKGAVLFLVFVAYELILAQRKTIKAIIPVALLSVLYVGLYLRYLPGRLDFVHTTTGIVSANNNPFIQLPVAIWMYIRLIFWPNYLDIFHAIPFITFQTFIIGYIVCAGFLCAGIIAYRYNRLLFFFLLLFLIPLIPVLTPFRIASFFAERYAYISTAGIMAIVGYGVIRIAKQKQYRQIVYAVVLFATILLMARTIVRAADLRSDDTLAQSGMREDPTNPIHLENYANMYVRNNQLYAAAAVYKTILQHNSNDAIVHTNLGYVFAQQGKLDQAFIEYNKALRINPNLWELHDNMAAYYVVTKDNRHAIEHIQKALQENTNNALLLFHAAIVYYAAGDLQTARMYINNVYMENPTNPQIKYYRDLINQ